MKQAIIKRLELFLAGLLGHKKVLFSEDITNAVHGLIREVKSLPDVYRTVDKEDAKYAPWGMENKVRPIGNGWINPEYLVSIKCDPNEDGTYKLYQHGHHVADVEYMMLSNVEFVSFNNKLRGIGKVCLRGGMGTTAERTEAGHGLHILLKPTEAAPLGTTRTYRKMRAPNLTQKGCDIEGAVCVAWCKRGIFATYTY